MAEFLQKLLYPEQWQQRETRIQQRETTTTQENMKRKLMNLQQKAQIAYQTGGPDAFRTVMNEGLPLIDPNLAKIFQQGQVQPGAPLFQPPGTPLEQAREKYLKAATEAMPREAEAKAMAEMRETEKWKEAKKTAGEERQTDAWKEFFALGEQPGQEAALVRGGQLTPMMGLDKPYSAGHLMPPQRPRAGGPLPTVPGMKMGYEFDPFGALAGATATTPTPEKTRGVFQPVEGPGGFVTSLIDPVTGRRIKDFGKAPLSKTIGGVAAEALQKTTVGQIEKDVVELQGTLGELEQIESEFNESFFTYRGKATAGITAFLEKAEVPIAKDARDFLAKKTKFFADSKRVFLKFRKFITGVAGGIEEFKEIAKSTIDPEKDSPTQFKAKLNSMRDNAIRLSNLMMALRNSGFDPRNKQNIKNAISTIPLEKIPLEIPPGTTLETLSTPQDIQSMSDEELRRIVGGG